MGNPVGGRLHSADHRSPQPGAPRDFRHRRRHVPGKVLSRRGLPGRVRQILHRPVLLAFLIFNLLLVLILPQFVLFIR